MLATLRDFVQAGTRWQTWVLMGNLDIRMRYRRSLLGPFWISLSLAGLIVALTLLYSQIFEQPFVEYLSWLSSGFLVWYLLSGMILEGCAIGTEAESQLRNVAIPIPVLAARMVYRNWIVFLHNLIVVVGLILIFRVAPTSEMLWVIPGVVMVMAIGFFAANVLGPICLRFRDVPQVVTNIVQIIFFVTPILWRPDQGRVRSEIVHANPFYNVIELVRAPILGHAPTLQNWISSELFLGALILLSIVTLLFSRKRIFLWL